MMQEERELLRRARELWEEGKFYEAHEVLEDIWRLFPKEDRLSRQCYQGLIRLAIAINHYQQGRRESSLRVLNMCRDQLSSCTPTFRDIDVACLVSWIEEAMETLQRGGNIERFPKL